MKVDVEASGPVAQAMVACWGPQWHGEDMVGLAAEGALHMRASGEPQDEEGPAGAAAPKDQDGSAKGGWTSVAGKWVQNAAKGLATAHS